MTSVGNIIDRLLPDGYRSCPNWPPDMFAVTASLIERSGCYAFPEYTAGWDKGRYRFQEQYRVRVQAAGRRWAKEPDTAPPEVVALWRRLIRQREAPLFGGATGKRAGSWRDIAMQLLAIADEASAGAGFVSPDYLISLFIYRQHIKKFFGNKAENEDVELPYLPYSLCIRVPTDEACVQPKVNTPVVGCTLRSLSHNLSLLPPIGVVATDWIYGHTDLHYGSAAAEEESKPLNLLIVPFPYKISGRSFAASDPVQTEIKLPDQYFSLDMTWLRSGDRPLPAATIARFLSELVSQAEREVGEVHGVVLPETALTRDYAERVARILASDHEKLELFITGVLDEGKPGTGLMVNGALTFTANIGGAFHTRRLQSKHHRWMLEAGQISRYHLGHVLDPETRWWEQIDVNSRTCQFTNVRAGASFAVLICEDLARADPVLPVLNAIGPNLVIALLMDGPQLKVRWPARYAMALADDPGSSVLTLSCLGMIKRSQMPGDNEAREIGLWKHPGGDIQELKLPKGSHALLLTLTMKTKEQYTLDLRSDEGAAVQFRLTGVRSVRAPVEPKWIDWR